MLDCCFNNHSRHCFAGFLSSARAGPFKPDVASIAEIFVVIEFSNGCFWLTKRLLIVLADYNIHILTYRNATCCRPCCVSFFAECRLMPMQAYSWKQKYSTQSLSIFLTDDCVNH